MRYSVVIISVLDSSVCCGGYFGIAVDCSIAAMNNSVCGAQWTKWVRGESSVRRVERRGSHTHARRPPRAAAAVAPSDRRATLGPVPHHGSSSADAAGGGGVGGGAGR